MPENLREMPMDPSIGVQGVAPAPMSPAETPISDPSMLGGQQQVDPQAEAEMRFDLERMLGNINNKDAAFKEKQVLNSEKLESTKARIIKEMFSLMEDLGIDPSNLNSINEFLQKLQYQDPDLYILFESAMNSLDEGGVAPGMEAVPGMPGTEAAPGMPVMEAGPPPGPMPGPMPGPGPAPVEENSGLMESNTTNLQEGMLRQ